MNPDWWNINGDYLYLLEELLAQADGDDPTYRTLLSRIREADHNVIDAKVGQLVTNDDEAEALARLLDAYGGGPGRVDPANDRSILPLLESEAKELADIVRSCAGLTPLASAFIPTRLTRARDSVDALAREVEETWLACVTDDAADGVYYLEPDVEDTVDAGSVLIDRAININESHLAPEDVDRDASSGCPLIDPRFGPYGKAEYNAAESALWRHNPPDVARFIELTACLGDHAICDAAARIEVPEEVVEALREATSSVRAQIAGMAAFNRASAADPASDDDPAPSP